jgi:hypothetical protein
MNHEIRLLKTREIADRVLHRPEGKGLTNSTLYLVSAGARGLSVEGSWGTALDYGLTPVLQ